MDDSVLDNVKSKSSWSLDSDEKLIKYLENFSNHLNNQLIDINENLNSLSQLSKVTKVNLNQVFNDFDSASNNQFIENRVYEDDVYIRKHDSLPVLVKRTKEEIEAAIIPKFKEAVVCGLKSLQHLPTPNSNIKNLSHCLIGSNDFILLSTKEVKKIDSSASLKILDEVQNTSDRISYSSSILDEHSTISNEFNFTSILNTDNTLNFDYVVVNSVKPKIDASISKVDASVKDLFGNRESDDDDDMFASIMQAKTSKPEASHITRTGFDLNDDDDEDLFGETRLKFNTVQKPTIISGKPSIGDKANFVVQELIQSQQSKQSNIGKILEVKKEDLTPVDKKSDNKPVTVMPTSIFGDGEDENDFFTLLAKKTEKSVKPISAKDKIVDRTAPDTPTLKTEHTNVGDSPVVILPSKTNDITTKDNCADLQASNSRPLERPNKSPKKDKLFDIFSEDANNEDDDDDIFNLLLKSPKKKKVPTATLR